MPWSCSARGSVGHHRHQDHHGSNQGDRQPGTNPVPALLGALSSYTRRLSSAVESLPDVAEDLRVNELDGPVPPAVVCNQVAIHTQAAAAGIDQARTAVSVAHRLSGRLRTQGH